MHKTRRNDGPVEQSHGQQVVSGQSACSICTSFSPPIMYPGTSFTCGRISAGSGHIMSETAFININQGGARFLIRTDFIRENTAFFFIRLRVRKSFFYG